jgi:hypothetical protein
LGFTKSRGWDRLEAAATCPVEIRGLAELPTTQHDRFQGAVTPTAESPKPNMSRLNGDKSRHQINRKRVVLRRAKIKKLVEDARARRVPEATASEKQPGK